MAREPLPYVSEFLEPRLLLAGTVSAQEVLNSARPPLFVENLGQWTSEIRYLFKGSGATVLMTDTGPVFHLLQERIEVGPSPDPLADMSRFAQARGLITDSFSVRFEGANVVFPRGADRSETVHNYYIGDASTWRTNVPTFGSVVYLNLYDGIDLHTWSKSGSLKYEFHLAPGADPRQVRLRYDGVDSLHLNAAGQLVAGTSLGDVIDDAPLVYQLAAGERSIVDSRFRVRSGTTVGFDLGSYDATRPLIIDPNVAWSTYLGGSLGSPGERGQGIATDGNGDAMITGFTTSTNFAGANNSHHGGTMNPLDAFVAKVNGATGAQVWATYLGGSLHTGGPNGGNDEGLGIAVDAAGNALVTGLTSSTDFAGANNSHHGALYDAFVAKVSGSGLLVWSTYLGGSFNEEGLGIAVDSAGNAMVSGHTTSTNFAGANNAHNGGTWDAFVAKVSSTGNISWATYLGGNTGSRDFGFGVATDPSGDVLVAGATDSTNFTGANNTHRGGLMDAFAAKVSSTGALAWATYLGGTGGLDQALAIASDAAGDALLTGRTTSTDFEVLSATNSSNGGTDSVVAKVDGSAGTIVWATYLGGSGADALYGPRNMGIAIDSAGDAFVTGITASTDFAGALNGHNGGTYDAFVSRVDGNTGVQAWAFYLGGSGSDEGYGIALDGAGDVFVTGGTDSTNLPLATNGLLGAIDAFVVKLAIGPEVIAADFIFCGLTLPATHELYFDFSEDVSASLTNTDLVLLNTTTNTLVPTGFITLDSYNPTLNRATFSFPGFPPTGFPPGVLPDGRYQATFVPGGVTDPTGNALPPNYVFNFFFLMGDANHDGVVNLLDFNILASPVNFGQSTRDFCDGDFNYDGTVNLTDFNILATRFGNRI